MLLRKLWSPAGFVLVGICFLFPFVAVSCTIDKGVNQDGTYSLTYTGADLITGGNATVSIPELPSVPEAGLGPIPAATGEADTAIGSRGAQAAALTAVTAVVLGVLAFLIPGRRPRALTSAALALVALTGTYLSYVLSKDWLVYEVLVPGMAKLGSQAVTAEAADLVSPRWGLWTAWGLLLVLMVSNVDAWVRARFTPQPVTPAE